ncbi:DUF3185 domain-containing protein [bacterium]|nr:DUF3185 domain-containing protein [bacterium]
MNIISVTGIALTALGVVGLIYGGITYTSSQDVVDMGSVHLQVDQEKRIPLSPIAGAAAVAIGVVMIFVGRNRSTRRGAG